MKNNTTIALFTCILWLGCAITGSAQSNGCTQCEGGSNSGSNASVIGKNNNASGNNAFAGGYSSTASGSNSFAFGYNSKASQSTNIAIGNSAQATGIGATAIGAYVKASAQNSYVIGSGTTSSYPLTNSTPNSIALGVNSTKPTMLITKSLNNSFTGKVAIGNITSPQAKLHIKSDSNEDADLLIEPSNKIARKASLYLFDNKHKIGVDYSGTMELTAGSGAMNFIGNLYCFGRSTEAKTRLYTNGITGIYSNAKRDNNMEVRDIDAPSYAIDFLQDGLRFRTAKKQDIRGSEITNWKESLYLCTDGRIGIGSKTTYIQNKEDQAFIINGPQNMDLRSSVIELNSTQTQLNASEIKLNGRIGVNTDNLVEGYDLAVKGGIISTKVFVKEAAQWPDYVFNDHHQLMQLNELKHYVQEHHHLPGVPSEAEITTQGYDLHQMLFIMMEKIEETTRYLLDLQEEIDSLKTQQGVNAQVCFTYDENGNRITRSLNFKRIDDLEQEPHTRQAFDCELYPNPTPGQFTVAIKTEGTPESFHATLLTSSGTRIEERMIQGNQTVFDLSAFANGVYLLIINSQEGSQNWKVIKQ